MKTSIILFLFFSIIFGSCKRNEHFEKYLGTWQPIYGQNQQLISRIQFMRLKDFYIAGIEYNERLFGNEIFFYVCEKEKNYFIIRPNRYYLESRSFDFVLTRPTRIYYDPEFNNLYLSNFVFKSSPKSIFQYVNKELIIMKE